MTYQEIAKNIIDKLPNDKMIYVMNILENIGNMSGINVYPEYEPNAETIDALEEVNNMIKDGTGEHFNGQTSDFFDDILKG